MFHVEPGVGMVNDKSASAALELAGYLWRLVEERRAAPCDDLISSLVQAEVTDDDGTRRSPHLTGMHRVRHPALQRGTETVAKLLGNAAVVLADYPEQRAELVAESDLIPDAIEELLRYEPPSPVQGRWATRPVDIHGTTLREGCEGAAADRQCRA